MSHFSRVSQGFCAIVLIGSVVVPARGAPVPAADYWSEPQGDYDSRRAAYLEHVVSKGTSVYAQVARLELERGPLDESAIRKAIDTIVNRVDGADFAANALLRMLHSPSPLLKAGLRQDIKRALLGLKYWVDEPGGKDLLSVWSENHQINYHAAQFLAGELFGEDTFKNTVKLGTYHRDLGRARVLRWIDVKARSGFSEWDSNNCFINTSAALMNLAELARDPEVAKRAAMILDVMFFDIAADSFRGSYGSPHGRTYPRGITAGGALDDTAALQRIAWGMGALGKPDSVAAIYLATSKRYRVARTIEALAAHFPDELTNKERQGLKITDGKRFGLRLDDPGTHFLLHGAGEYSKPEYIEQSLKVIDGLHIHRYGLVMRPYAEAVLGTYRELQKRGMPLVDLDKGSVERVDKITYRTPDYQLSTVQDYRKGLPGAQQHIWQATLGPGTPVFTINPGPTSKYWQGRFPRNGQHENVLVAIYDIPAEPLPGPRTIYPPDAKGDAMPSPAPSEDKPDPRTLAVFRRAEFDEVVQKNGWTFGRRGPAYVALWSRAPTTWSNEVFGGEGLVAEARKNVWICQLGREKKDGAFAAWTARLAAAKLDATESSVKYRAPGVGEVSFAWEGPLRVAGRTIPLTDYMRFDNPYARVPWGTGRYQIAHAGHRLIIDFDKLEHKETVPAEKRPAGRKPPQRASR
jgi:hypothetical protein